MSVVTPVHAAHPVGAEAGRLPYNDDRSQQQHTVVLVRKVPTLEKWQQQQQQRRRRRQYQEGLLLHGKHGLASK
jgi:hypothetical protein